MRARFWRRAAIAPVAALSIATIAPHVSAVAPFLTPTPAMLTVDASAPAGTKVLPIISVGGLRRRLHVRRDPGRDRRDARFGRQHGGLRQSRAIEGAVRRLRRLRLVLRVASHARTERRRARGIGAASRLRWLPAVLFVHDGRPGRRLVFVPLLHRRRSPGSGAGSSRRSVWTGSCLRS